MLEFKLDDLLINEKATVKESMKRLDEVASRILFVISDNNLLIGSLTDGDIRRFILSNGCLNADVSEACNKNCYKIHNSFDNDTVLNEMEELDIVYAPVVNDSGCIVEIFSLPLSKRRIINFSSKKINIPVVIMAGGKGTRMAPFTNVLPKPLIPVGDKTILEIIINEFRIFGVDDFYLTINYRGEMIKAYFDCIEKDYRVTYLKEDDFFGTAGSLKLLPGDFADTFIVSNCDIIVKADYSDVLDFHKKTGALLTVLSSIQHHKIPYGVINFETGGQVTSLEEKPEYSFCINTGVYILDIDCLKYIREGEVFHMTHLMEAIIKDGKKVVTYPVKENDYTDIGQWDEYRKTLEMFQG